MKRKITYSILACLLIILGLSGDNHIKNISKPIPRKRSQAELLAKVANFVKSNKRTDPQGPYEHPKHPRIREYHYYDPELDCGINLGYVNDKFNFFNYDGPVFDGSGKNAFVMQRGDYERLGKGDSYVELRSPKDIAAIRGKDASIKPEQTEEANAKWENILRTFCTHHKL